MYQIPVIIDDDCEDDDFQQHKFTSSDMVGNEESIHEISIDAIHAKRRYRLDDGRTGQCKFIGSTSFASGVWVGIVLDSGAHGNTNGSVFGRKYFTCRDGKGVFVRPQKIVAALSESVVLNPQAPPPPRAAHIGHRSTQSGLSMSGTSPLHFDAGAYATFDDAMNALPPLDDTTAAAEAEEQKVQYAMPLAATVDDTDASHSHSHSPVPVPSTYAALRDYFESTASLTLNDATASPVAAVNAWSSSVFLPQSPWQNDDEHDLDSVCSDSMLDDEEWRNRQHRARQASMAQSLLDAETVSALTTVKKKVTPYIAATEKWKPPQFAIIPDHSDILQPKLRSRRFPSSSSCRRDERGKSPKVHKKAQSVVSFKTHKNNKNAKNGSKLRSKTPRIISTADAAKHAQLQTIKNSNPKKRHLSAMEMEIKMEMASVDDDDDEDDEELTDTQIQHERSMSSVSNLRSRKRNPKTKTKRKTKKPAAVEWYESELMWMPKMSSLEHKKTISTSFSSASASKNKKLFTEQKPAATCLMPKRISLPTTKTEKHLSTSSIQSTPQSVTSSNSYSHSQSSQSPALTVGTNSPALTPFSSFHSQTTTAAMSIKTTSTLSVETAANGGGGERSGEVCWKERIILEESDMDEMPVPMSSPLMSKAHSYSESKTKTKKSKTHYTNIRDKKQRKTKSTKLSTAQKRKQNLSSRNPTM